MPNFQDLISDIEEFLENPESEISEDGLKELLENIESTLRDAFGGKNNKRKDKEKKLYASNLGLPPRRLWFSLRSKGDAEQPISAQLKMNFLFGSIIENLIVCLAREAGHFVTEEQKRVEIDGVSGKKDCRIDNMLVDVKSASSFSFKKFNSGEFLMDDVDTDPFGYKYQLGFYMKEANDEKGAFVVVNKENGAITSLVLDRKHDIPDVNLKIEQAKILLEQDTPPVEKCYPEVPRGKSGNCVLHKLCTFCDYKDICWKEANDGKGLIQHEYSDGTVYFTKLVKEPQNKAKDDGQSSEQQ